MKGLEKPEVVVLAVLNYVRGSLSNDTVMIVGELVDHNEIGVALEILCSQIVEYGIDIGGGYKARLKDVALSLGIPLSQLDGLSE